MEERKIRRPAKRLELFRAPLLRVHGHAHNGVVCPFPPTGLLKNWD